ncbi:restriction endonuclease subunit S [Burkholderia stabilis]|uniref:restriction endonuclease subunit S n=1 Tax=Burkholderia stabilis TaxID=95485 RepID=UPI001588494C|nr:restriction endonuclease subunit S [Burkholderia stabilis]
MANRAARKVPPVRFKVFEAEWEDERIGNVIVEKKRPIILNDHQRYELITVKRRSEGIVSRGHLLGRDILVKNYGQLQTGDFVISKRQVVHGATGIVPLALDGAIVSNEYLTAVDSDKLLTEFLTIVARLPAMRRKFFLSSYGVDIEKLFFDTEDWKKRNVTIPGVDEQVRISSFFRKLDQLIGLHQRKHDKLEALKKAMLQKMFPQPGAATPEVRFHDFSGGWVEKKLGDIGIFRRGISYSSKDVSQSGLLVLRSTNIQNARLILDSDLQFINVECPEDIRLRRGDIAICMSNGSKVLVGKSATCENDPVHPVTVGAFCSIFRSTNPIAAYLLQTTQYLRYVNELLAGSSINNLKNSDLSELVFRVPTDNTEQRKIGVYFRTLDSLIFQHAAQLLKLQQIKSTCLENMFV